MKRDVKAIQLSLFTNEERRGEPTVPESVTQDTPLAALNLNWRERDLPEKERTKHVHRLHPYLGKFIPQLVEIFLRKYFRPGDTVYDPFCGSGTALVEANALNIHSIGCDISAFNCLLAKVKTQKYDPQLVRKEVLDILAKTREKTQRTLLSTPDEEFQDTDNPYLLSWFAPQARRELLTYCSLIPDYHYQDLLKVILSRAARSARLTTHFDLDFPKEPQLEPYYCYKHSRICQPVQEAFKFLERYSWDTIHRIKEYSRIRTEARVIVLCDDARTVELPERINGVITSPPYVGLIDYHEQHRYAYEFLSLPDRRDLEIGPAVKGSSQGAREEYKRDIAEAFRHTAQYMDSGGRIIVVIHDKDDLYPQIADMCGFEVEGVLKSHVDRRTGRRANEFYESIFVWKN